MSFIETAPVIGRVNAGDGWRLEAKGLLPAIDCHPDARVRYLGVGPAGPPPASIEEDRPRTRYVNGYTRKDGTTVDGYLRAAPPP